MTQPTESEMRCFRDALRAFKHARGTHRRPHASTIGELVRQHPSLAGSIDEFTAIALRFYNR